jgi:hypothetical protein
MSNLATIVNNILADSGIDDINVVVTTGSYTNPAWIVSLPWTKITGTPTTLAGYGITDAYTQTQVNTLLNAKQNTLTLTTTGTSGAATLVGATLNIPQYQSVLTNPVTGTGSVGQVAYWSSGSVITGESVFIWDATNNRLGIGRTSPAYNLDVLGSGNFTGALLAGGDIRSVGIGSNTVVDGAFISLYDGATAKQMLHQLNASFGEDIWAYTGSAWNKVYTLSQSGEGTYSSSISAYNGEVIIQSATINNSWIGNNVAYDGNFKYRVNGYAQALYFDASDFEIRVADTGLTGNNITWRVGLRIYSVSGNVETPQDFTANKIIKAGGTTSQFLKANGDVDSTSYQPILTNPVTGTGTTNYLPKFTGASAIGNSAITEDGTTVTLIGRALSGVTATFTHSSGDTITLSKGSGPSIRFSKTAATAQDWAIAGEGTAFKLYNYTAGTVPLMVDTSGNLGLGVTPSAWLSTNRAIQLGYGAVRSFTNSANTYLENNNFVNSTGTDIYLNNGPAGRYRIADNQHIWYQAPSGTAGNAITFTQAMTLNASGNLSIGNTNDSYKLDVSGAGVFRGDGNILQLLSSGTTTQYQKWSNGGGNYFIGISSSAGLGLLGSQNAYSFCLVTESARDMSFGTTNTSRMTIFADGNVGINTGNTNAGYKLDVSGTGRFTGQLSASLTSSGTPLRIDVSTGGNVTSNTKFVIGTGGQAGSQANKKFLDIDFNGYLNYTFARIRSWDESSSTGQGSLYFYTNSGTTDANILALQLSHTGAATFSSSVSGTSAFFSAKSSFYNVYIGGTPSGDNYDTYSDSVVGVSNLHLGTRLNTGVLYINYVNSAPTIINYGGGNVGIGNITSASSLLHIQRSILGGGLGDGILLTMKNASTVNDTRSCISFGNISGIGGALAMQAAILKNSTTGEYDMTWDLYGGAASWQENLLYLDSNPGTVSIGTAGSQTTSTYAGRLSVHKAGSGANIVLGTGSNTNNAVMSRFVTYNSNNGNSGNEGVSQFYGITSIESALTTANSNASGNSGGYIMFKTKSDAGTLEERVRVTDIGNVLVNTTSTIVNNRMWVNLSGTEGFRAGTWETYSYTVNNAFIMENAYFDNNFKRRASGYAIALYSDAGSGFQVRMAGTGAAGSTISWVNAMQLNASYEAIFHSKVTATSFFESSDIRLKSNIKNYSPNGISEIVAKLYEKDGKLELGYIAQDLQGVLDSAISIRENEMLDLSYRQVHTAKIASLEKEVRELKEQLKNK